MDQYGIYQDCDGDYEELAICLKTHSSVIFTWEKVNCFTILMCSDFCVAGSPNFGGFPVGRTIVSVFGAGMFHFKFPFDTHFSYLEEKLLISKSSAKQLEILFKGISKYL